MISARSFLAAFGTMATVVAVASCGGGNSDASGSEQGASGMNAGSPGDAAGVSGGGNGSAGSGGTGSPTLEFGGSSGGKLDPSQTGCARATAHAERIPANLLFVLDTSGSMNCNPPDGDAALAARCARYPLKEDETRPSKWEVTKTALANALETLVDAPNVSAGLMLFPREGECGVSVEPSIPIAPLDETHLGELTDALDGVSPAGETPVAGATILSYAHLASRLRDRTLTGNSFVILLTDGAETCAPDVLDPLVGKDVPNARGFDIRTFVIGAPGSELASPLLSTVAWEGGTAASESCVHDPAAETGDCHLDMTATPDFEQALEDALEAIANTEALSCDIAVPENSDGGGVDLNRVNVSFTPEGGEARQIANDSAPCSEANGWQYSEDSSKIVLCGDACQTLKRDKGELSIVLGCPTIRVR